jgi:hypothetical protein
MSEIVKKPRAEWQGVGRGAAPGHHPPGAVLITTETGRAMANRRWAMAREKAAEGLKTAVEKHIEKTGGKAISTLEGDHSPEAWGKMIEHAATIFLNSNSARGLSDLGAFVGKSAGMLLDPNVKVEAEQSREGSLDEARVLLQVFQFFDGEKKEEGEIIDAIQG